ncbi:MAG: LptF/LptG family permease [Balneolaceae bacterium]
MKRLDRYIMMRLLTITFFVVGVLIAIFILIDFSENSDNFADAGASLAQIWQEYYRNYIPEMVRLVSPIAVFVACLFLAGQMSERLEITAIKAAGISLYRLALPYMLFAGLLAGVVAWLDSEIIPQANQDRIAFEQEYLNGQSDYIDRGKVFRQEAPGRIFQVGHYSAQSATGYRMILTEFDEGNRIQRVLSANRIDWVDSLQVWKAGRFTDRIWLEEGYRDTTGEDLSLTLNLQPRDLARRSSDIFQLTWQEALDYIDSIERSGAGGIELPLVQLYGRMAYPFSLLIVTLIGFSLATERRKGGRGFYIAAGLTISFLYLALIKIMEPLGSSGAMDPLWASLLPHLLFLGAGTVLFFSVKK